ncbi:MAG TPA: ATP-dependent DNA helicase [Acidimicrobiia bacterium]|nr:ATP-dependent DNA helicase [Acidimicrobiia bacterium]
MRGAPRLSRLAGRTGGIPLVIIPTAEQLAVIEHPLEPLRVEAGAGTGKTATIAMRVVHLVNDAGLEPESILGITFTNKAAAELADRIRAALGRTSDLDPGREVEVHTYHGFAHQLLREYGALVEVERSTEVITPTFSRQLIEVVMANTELPALNPANRGNVDDIRRLGSALGDNLLEPDQIEIPSELDQAWSTRASLLKGLHAYQQEKRRRGVVDYSDLILRAQQLVSKYPDVSKEFRSRYRAVMLDEYQDTNPAQRELLRLLFGDGFPVMAVGDIDQTIYEWRGASPHNFAQFPSHFPRSDGQAAPTRSLTLNRRSLPAILSVANALREKTGSGQKLLRPLDDSIGGEVAVSWHSDAVAESEDIARRIQELSATYEWRDMAVLFRKNKDMTLVHDALRAAEIPVEVANLGGLLAVPEVTDVHAWLRLLQVPEDSPALYRILLGSRFRLGLGDLAHLSNWARGLNRLSDEEVTVPQHTLLEAIDHLDDLELRPAARVALERFREEYRSLLATAQGVSLVELCRQILDRTGAWNDLAAMPANTQLSARLNLYRFLDLTEDWSPLEGAPSLGAFLRHLEAMAEERSEELDTARLSGENAVTLVTVHRAKGLEWDVVFLPACYQGNFPAKSHGYDNPLSNGRYLPYEYRLDQYWLPPISPKRSDAENRDLLRAAHENQEWRIAYVAATRPRQRLFVSGAFWYGVSETNTRAVGPSEVWTLVASQPGTRVDSRPSQAPPQPSLLRFEPEAGAPDPLFADGWEQALRNELMAPGWARTLAADGFTLDRKRTEFEQMILDLPAPLAAPSEHSLSTSVTGLVTYASCPRRFFWSEIERLPRMSSQQARAGTLIHRAIELHNRGHVPLEDVDWNSVDPFEDSGERPETSWSRFQRSRFAQVPPIMIEQQFMMRVGEIEVKGRIDAVYDRGGWEIVDFKTGSPTEDHATNEARLVQLQAYASAARQGHLGRPAPPSLHVTFAYFGARPAESTYAVDTVWEESASDRLHSLAGGIEAKDWTPTPSMACHSCDFLRFCPAGRRFMSNQG